VGKTTQWRSCGLGLDPPVPCEDNESRVPGHFFFCRASIWVLVCLDMGVISYDVTMCLNCERFRCNTSIMASWKSFRIFFLVFDIQNLCHSFKIKASTCICQKTTSSDDFLKSEISFNQIISFCHITYHILVMLSVCMQSACNYC